MGAQQIWLLMEKQKSPPPYPIVDYNPGEEAGFRPGLEGKGDTSSTYQKKGLIIYKSNFSIDYLRKLQKLDVLLKYLRTTSHEGHVQL